VPHVLVLPGDGIGPEVVEAAVQVVEASGVSIDWDRVEAGAEVVDAPQDRPWGSRTGVLRDPFGYRWSISKMIEDMKPAIKEMGL